MVEVMLPVKLGGNEYETVWDANTMREYEKACHVGYWETFLALLRFYDDNKAGLDSLGAFVEGEPQDATRARWKLYQQISTYISTESLVCLLWAAIHSYDEDDNPVHPLSVNRVARLLKPMDTIQIVFLVINGHLANAPTKRELGEASGGSDKKIVPMPEATPKQRVNGGLSGTGLPEDAFASAEENPVV